MMKVFHYKQFLGSAQVRNICKMEFWSKKSLEFSFTPVQRCDGHGIIISLYMKTSHPSGLEFVVFIFALTKDFKVLVITLGRESPWDDNSSLMRANGLSGDTVIYSQGQEDQFSACWIPLLMFSTLLD